MKRRNKQKLSIVANVLHLLYGTAASAILQAIALLLLASYLQAHDFGVFSVALAMAMIMGYFTDAGLGDLVLREGSKKAVVIQTLIVSYVKIRLLFLILTFSVGLSVVWLLYSVQQEVFHLSVALILPIVIGLMFQSIASIYFQLIERMQYMSVIKIVSAAALVLIVILGVLMQVSPMVIAFLYGCAYLIAGMVGMVLLFLHLGRVDWKAPFHVGLLNQMWTYTIGGLLFVILPHLGPLVLERTLSLVEVGLFALAYRIPQALQQLPSVVASAFYPRLFSAYQQGQHVEHLRLNMIEMKWMAIISSLIALPFLHLAEPLLHLVFGAEWSLAAPALIILSMMLVVQALNIAVGDGLTTSGKQKTRTMMQLVAVLIGIGLYVTLSLQFGVIGAAIAGVMIEAIALVLFWLFYPFGKKEIIKRVLLPYPLVFFGSGIVLQQLHVQPLLPVYPMRSFFFCFSFGMKMFGGRLQEKLYVLQPDAKR
ncbi:oligosaccharide flippase family protein [Geomicrobium sp. JCM 19038]|uniref:oligosaccharide flippase family protein n=1 Tax=Geomicrobium sp. JCM 19038 TaxID=1460635 RepID=UPI00126896E1|nr:oligosaccharide flippase family protein [Geomicrobium sp. JCM 19038]